MSINLSKGQKIDLRKNVDNTENNLSKMVIGLGWDIKRGAGDYDLDACALLLQNDSLLSTDDIVSYQNTKHTSNTVWSTGDNLTGDGDGDDEQIIALLDTVPNKYNKIVFYATIYQGNSRGQEFSKVKNAFIRAVDRNGKQLAKYNISNDPSANGMCSVVFAEAIRNGDTWEFRAVGNYYKTDKLRDVADMYRNGTQKAQVTSNSDSSQPRKKLFGLF